MLPAPTNDTWYSYQSPYGSRYGSARMLYLWSEKRTKGLWAEYWLQDLLRSKAPIRPEDKRQAQNLLSNGIPEPTFYRAKAIERENRHDLAAFLQAVTELFPPGSPVQAYLHLGCTSSDPQDYATEIQLEQANALIQERLVAVLNTLSHLIHQHHDTVILGRTHLQPAEPTTLGYRLAVYAEQLLVDLDALFRFPIPTKRHTGAVGTDANRSLFWVTLPPIGRPEYLATGQTAPRQVELRMLQVLESVGATLAKMALDFRIMLMSDWLTEEKTALQIGSSAMPGKKNPIAWEKITGITRSLPNYTRALWDAVAGSALERTLDDSSARRVALPEAFLALDECLLSAKTALDVLQVDPTIAMAEVVTHWKAWLPSRALALGQAQGHLRQHWYKRVTDELANTDSPAKYWAELFPPREGEHRLGDSELLWDLLGLQLAAKRALYVSGLVWTDEPDEQERP